VYEEGGRIVWIKPGMEDLIFGSSSAAAAAPEQPAELKITVQE
jgi:large subunit ribosomal protein L28